MAIILNILGLLLLGVLIWRAVVLRSPLDDDGRDHGGSTKRDVER